MISGLNILNNNLGAQPNKLLAELLHNYCYTTNDNDIIICLKSLKLLNKNKIPYDFLLEHLIKIIDIVLSKNIMFNIHINVKSISIVDVDINQDFIKKASLVLKDKYPYKLENCYIYEAPSIFTSLCKIIFAFIDKETQKKFKIIEMK
jgi:hypothetical protein